MARKPSKSTLDKQREAARRIAEKERAARIKEAQKARDAQTRDEMRNLRQTGLYAPTSNKLTKSRRARVKKLTGTFSELLSADTFFFIPLKGNLKDRKKVSRTAKQRNLTATLRGIFLPKGEYTSAKVRKSRKVKGETIIELDGWEKRGEKKRKRKKAIIPLTPLDKLTLRERKLERMAGDLGPLGPNDRYAFEVIDPSDEGHNGYSHNTFDSYDKLLAKLHEYIVSRTKANGLRFLRMVRIVKTTVDEWSTIHPPYQKPRRRRSRAKGARKPRN